MNHKTVDLFGSLGSFFLGGFILLETEGLDCDFDPNFILSIVGQNWEEKTLIIFVPAGPQFQISFLLFCSNYTLVCN